MMLLNILIFITISMGLQDPTWSDDGQPVIIGAIHRTISSKIDVRNLNGAIDGARSLGSGTAEGRQELVSDAADGVQELASEAAEGAQDLASGAQDLASDAAEGAQGLASEAASGAQELASDAASGAQELASDAADGASELASDAADGAQELASRNVEEVYKPTTTELSTVPPTTTLPSEQSGRKADMSFGFGSKDAKVTNAGKIIPIIKNVSAALFVNKPSPKVKFMECVDEEDFDCAPYAFGQVKAGKCCEDNMCGQCCGTCINECSKCFKDSAADLIERAKMTGLNQPCSELSSQKECSALTNTRNGNADGCAWKNETKSCVTYVIITHQLKISSQNSEVSAENQAKIRAECAKGVANLPTSCDIQFSPSKNTSPPSPNNVFDLMMKQMIIVPDARVNEIKSLATNVTAVSSISSAIKSSTGIQVEDYVVSSNEPGTAKLNVNTFELEKPCGQIRSEEGCDFEGSTGGENSDGCEWQTSGKCAKYIKIVSTFKAESADEDFETNNEGKIETACKEMVDKPATCEIQIDAIGDDSELGLNSYAVTMISKIIVSDEEAGTIKILATSNDVLERTKESIQGSTSAAIEDFVATSNPSRTKFLSTHSFDMFENCGEMKFKSDCEFLTLNGESDADGCEWNDSVGKCAKFVVIMNQVKLTSNSANFTTQSIGKIKDICSANIDDMLTTCDVSYVEVPNINNDTNSKTYDVMMKQKIIVPEEKAEKVKADASGATEIAKLTSKIQLVANSIIEEFESATNPPATTALATTELTTTGFPSPQPTTTTPPPTLLPSEEPSPNPSEFPSPVPTPRPTSFSPSTNPTADPIMSTTTLNPSLLPTFDPSRQPINNPTFKPSPLPNFEPTVKPTNLPTKRPSPGPTVIPTKVPSPKPTTSRPTLLPTYDPTFDPTPAPSPKPSRDPIYDPTPAPSPKPTRKPTFKPSKAPTNLPTRSPSKEPSPAPVIQLMTAVNYDQHITTTQANTICEMAAKKMNATCTGTDFVEEERRVLESGEPYGKKTNMIFVIESESLKVYHVLELIENIKDATMTVLPTISLPTIELIPMISSLQQEPKEVTLFETAKETLVKLKGFILDSSMASKSILKNLPFEITSDMATTLMTILCMTLVIVFFLKFTKNIEPPQDKSDW